MQPFNFPVCLLSQIKTLTQIITDRTDPAGAAIPMGYRVSAKYTDARYASGIRAQMIEIKLCINEIPDKPYAQKYPLKQK